MFGRIALTLLDQGYERPIPVIAGSKRPIHAKWDRYNRRSPSTGEVTLWSKRHPEASVGYAAGGSVIGLDLDHLDPDVAFRFRDMADRILGSSPCVRIGQAPKSLRLYRRGDGEIATRRFLRANVEVFATGGQFMLFGQHPVTKAAYAWPEASPLDVHADDLPPLHADALAAFIAEIEPSMPERVRGASVGDGSTAEVLAFHATQPPGTTLAESCRRMMAAAALRHPTMLAVVLVLLQCGYDEEQIIAEIGDAYLSHFEPRELKERWHKLLGAIRKVPPSAVPSAGAVDLFNRLSRVPR